MKLKINLLLAAAGTLTLAALMATPASAGPCDVVLSFGSKDGRINQQAYDTLVGWIRANPDRTDGVAETAFPDGTRSLCITAPSREEIKPLFRDLGAILPDQKSEPGVTLVSTVDRKRHPRSTKVRGTGYNRDRAPPRDNGISSRPPLGNRN